MKKVLSLILAFVMIISCVAIMQVVTLADGNSISETKGIILDVDFSDPNVYGYNPDGIFNGGATTYDHENGMLKFDNTGSSEWHTPMWNITAKLKEFATKHADKKIRISVSLKMKSNTEGAKSRVLFRDKNSKDIGLTGRNSVKTDWTTFSAKTTYDASTILSADNNDFRLCWDGTVKGVYYVDDLLVTVHVVPVSDGLFEYGFEDDEFSEYFGNYLGKREYVTSETGKVHSGNYAMKYSGGDAAYGGIKLNSDAMYALVNHQAGVYKVSAWYYFETAPTDKNATLNLNCRISNNKYNNTSKCNDRQIEIGVWKQYTFMIDLSQTYVDDSAINLAFSEGAGNSSVYYIDDIKIERTTDVDNLTGFTVTYRNETDGAHYYNSPSEILSVQDAENGTVTKTFVVRNNGANTVDVKIEFQVSTGSAWVGTNGSGKIVSVKPNEEAVTSYSLTIDESGNFKLGDKTYNISKVFIRVDYDGGSGKKLPAGTSVTVYCDNARSFYWSGNGSLGSDRSDDYATDTPISNLTLNMDVGSTLDMNWYATFAKASTAEKAEVKILNNNQVKATLKGTAVENGKYKFAFTDVAPQDMAEVYTAELWVDGVKVSKRSESIKSYCKTAMNSATDEQKTFMSDMLNYGQAFADYKNTGDVIVAEDDTWITGSKFDDIKGNLIAQKQVAEVTDTNNRITSAGLYFYNENKIYFRATTEEDSTVKINGTETEIKNGKYYTEGIKATEFGKKFTVTVEKNGETLHSADYSVNDYILVKCDGDANINKLARALACYGNSANAVKGQQQ